MKDCFVRIAYNSDTDIWEEVDEELNSELNEISKAPLALYKKAKFLETENLRYKTQIEIGELCDRKETARDIVEMLKAAKPVVKIHFEAYDELIENIVEKYGIKLEDEE